MTFSETCIQILAMACVLRMRDDIAGYELRDKATFVLIVGACVIVPAQLLVWLAA